MRSALGISALLAILAVVPLLTSGCPPSTTPGNTEKLFNEVWDTFDAKYSYFELKGVNWNTIKTQYRPVFQQELSADDFAEELSDMLQVLHDWHVWVQKPGGAYLGYEGDYETNYPPALSESYTDGGYTIIGDNVIYHAWVGLGATKHVAYIVIDTLDSTQWAAVSDAAIGNMFVTYQNADGMIIDIRANSGGNEYHAMRIASRLTHDDVVYGYTRTRNGADHDDFDPLVTKTLTSSSGMHYDGPVIGLIGQKCMSSAEWFTLMLRACPNVTLMGDWTRGASGNPEAFALSNGVAYSVSRWIAYTADMEEIEDFGIVPDEYVPAELSCDDDHDYLLEEAIEDLEAR